MKRSRAILFLVLFSSAVRAQVSMIPQPVSMIPQPVSMIPQPVSMIPQPVSIIPQPVSIKEGQGTFKLRPSTVIVIGGDDLLRQANYLNDYLRTSYGFTLAVVREDRRKGSRLVLRNGKIEGGKEGAYVLRVGGDEVRIDGKGGAGVFYGIQSLLQLLPVSSGRPVRVPQVEIVDSPRFAYRGVMLDVGRHFFPVSYLRRFIDLLALHRINFFHWHLTDDQGWRIEIKKYPLLTSVGSCRNGTITGHPGSANDFRRDCGFYTQEEVKSLVKYAADRFITIIPEIEMPGHSSAAIAAYPGLSCFPDEPSPAGEGMQWAGGRAGKQVQQGWGVFDDVYCPSEYTFSFLQDVLDEVIPLFPSGYIHVGGDECPKTAWKRSAFCQQLIREKGLRDENELQSYFIGRIAAYVHTKGRRIIGWDEILEGGLAQEATVMSWRGEAGGIKAARQGHPVIMTPDTYVYFDYAQRKNEDSLTMGEYLPTEKVYGYEPLPAGLTPAEQQNILGAQANIWTEYIANPAKLEYMAFPRMAALSEVLWSPAAARNYSSFVQRLRIQLKRYDRWKVNYFR